LPSTGASRNEIPRSAASAAQRSVPSIPMVLICSQIASPAGAPDRAPSSPATASSTASASVTIVMITAAPSAASAGLS
jgi:hypothetical protein